MEIIGIAVGLFAVAIGIHSTYKSIKRNLDKGDDDE